MARIRTLGDPIQFRLPLVHHDRLAAAAGRLSPSAFARQIVIGYLDAGDTSKHVELDIEFSPEVREALELYRIPGQSLTDAAAEIVNNAVTDPGYAEQLRLAKLGKEFLAAEARLAAERNTIPRHEGSYFDEGTGGSTPSMPPVEADTPVPVGKSGVRGGWDAAAEIMPDGKLHPDDEWEKDTNWGDVVKMREARKDKAAEPGRGGLRADD